MTTLLASGPSPREALPMLMELVMRVTLKHYAARCLSCSQVFIFPVDNIQTVLDHRSPMFIHASTCSALHGIPMAEMLMRIRKYAANEDVEARSLALMDHLWRYFGEFHIRMASMVRHRHGRGRNPVGAGFQSVASLGRGDN